MKKLFWEDPYKKKCKAKVEKVDGKKIILDQSIFFAFSGGQASDKGTIGGIPVLSAEKEDPITYTLELEPGFKEGDMVKVKINWKHRYKLMKLHSAAHIVYEIFKETAGSKKIIGSNVSVKKARIDFEMDENVNEYLPEIEKKTKKIIQNDLKIETYEDENEKGKRWWEISGKWKMPCGGTHVKSTSEIGEIELKRKNIGAGKERIEIYLK
ncbi:MAG: alanyl-tRNA editing protein [Candidatus Undinarchaeales archaeon]